MQTKTVNTSNLSSFEELIKSIKNNAPLPPCSLLLRPVELLVEQMQQQVDIQPQVPLEQVHKLVSLKLRL